MSSGPSRRWSNDFYAYRRDFVFDAGRVDIGQNLTGTTYINAASIKSGTLTSPGLYTMWLSNTFSTGTVQLTLFNTGSQPLMIKVVSQSFTGTVVSGSQTVDPSFSFQVGYTSGSASSTSQPLFTAVNPQNPITVNILSVFKKSTGV